MPLQFEELSSIPRTQVKNARRGGCAPNTNSGKAETEESVPCATWPANLA